MDPEVEPLLTVPEVARRLRLSEQSVRSMIRRGELAAARLGGERGRPLRVDAGDLADRLRGWSNR